MKPQMKPAERDMVIHVSLNGEDAVLLHEETKDGKMQVSEYLLSLATDVIPKLRALHDGEYDAKLKKWFCKECSYAYPCDTIDLIGIAPSERRP